MTRPSFHSGRRCGAVSLLATLLLAGCAATGSARLMQGHGQFAPCENARACVSSQASDENFAVEPLSYVGPAPDARQKLLDVIQAEPRSEVVTNSGCYVHATFSSAMTRRTDDLELWFCGRPGKVEVRSSSRRPGFDLGSNRDRVEALRKALQFDPERPLQVDD